MINGFMSQTNDLDTFSRLQQQKKRIKPPTVEEKNNEVNEDINDEENVADQFMFWY